MAVRCGTAGQEQDSQNKEQYSGESIWHENHYPTVIRLTSAPAMSSAQNHLGDFT
jgi:hypothetical protein